MIAHMRMIHWILGVAEKNVEEAEKYAKKAHCMKMHNKAAADFCGEMARRHLEFNQTACMLLDQTCKELEKIGGMGEVMAATMAMVHERRERIAEETAEARVLLEMY